MSDAPGWSDRQLTALAALLETFVEPAYEGEPEQHATDAATVLSEVAEPSDLRNVRLLLRYFSLRGFAEWPRDRRERELLDWAGSRIPQRRAFFQLVKRFATFLAYAGPGPTGVNPRWQPMGYSVPDHELPDDSPLDRAILRPVASESVELEADVVVVGSGAGGGVAAARLAELGHDVLVLEAGEYVPERDMPRDERAAVDRLHLDHGLTATTDLAVAILAGSAVGGGTLVNWTTCVLPPDDERQAWAADLGLEMAAGPAADAELDRIRRELGFDAPPSIGPKDRAILDGAAALGWEAAATERNAAGCGDCGACSFGCRRGAKKSGQRLHLALAAGNGARILPGARVDRIRAGRGAASVHGSHAGRPLTVRARSVVLAAGALRSPAILLRSGFGHPHIGRNLRLHPTAVLAARFEQRIDMWRDTMQGARSLHFLADGFIIESAPGHPGLIAQSVPWTGAAEHAELMNNAGHDAPLIVIVHDTGSGRLALGRSGRGRVSYRISAADAATARAGLVAAAQIAHAAGARRLTVLGTPALEHVVAAQGAKLEAFLDRLRVADFAPNRTALFSAHQMGSVRAGTDAGLNPCDPWGMVRGTDNVFVADASLFPTALGVNPMVTVMWLAGRVASALHAGPGS